MANISLKNFVNIDIQPSIIGKIAGSRDTIALLTSEGTLGTTNLVDIDNYKEEIDATYLTTLAYLEVYFRNGGVKAFVVEGIANTSSAILGAMTELDDKYIVVAYATDETTITDRENNEVSIYNGLKDVALARAEDTTIYGINEKVLLVRSNDLSDPENVKNFAVKYSNNVGAEMTIGAYLSQIIVYGINTIQDYAFTKEYLTDSEIATEVVPTNTQFGYLMDRNYNVDIELQGDYRNCGGNNKDGESLVNNWTRIVLHQTLTERLIELLKTKIRSTDGVSKMYATLVDELEYYRVNGYLTTDKVWKYDTLVINGITIIEKGTPLLTGYQIKIFPMSLLTDEQKKNHEAPPIYIVLADQYSIRVINIAGEVI